MVLWQRMVMHACVGRPNNPIQQFFPSDKMIPISNCGSIAQYRERFRNPPPRSKKSGFREEVLDLYALSPAMKNFLQRDRLEIKDGHSQQSLTVHSVPMDSMFVFFSILSGFSCLCALVAGCFNPISKIHGYHCLNCVSFHIVSPASQCWGRQPQSCAFSVRRCKEIHQKSG